MRTKSIVKARRWMFNIAAVLVALLASGCALLGTQGRQYDESAVEATLQALAEAGVRQDVDGVSRYIAQTLQITVDTAASSILPLSQRNTIEKLNALWSDGTTNRFDLDIDNIYVDGNRASVTGSVFIDYLDATTNTRYHCVFTGEATLANQGGRWVVTQVTIYDQECTVVPGSGDPGPGDPGPGDPGDPGKPAHNPAEYKYYFDQGLYLTLGFKGEQVKALQEALAILGAYSGKIDGDFGPLTEAAVRKFQRDNGLYVDGEFGPKTQEALNKALQKRGGYFLSGSELTAYAGPTTVIQTALQKGKAVETPAYIYESPNPGPTLVFLGCIHGNEQSGHLALVDAINAGITISRGRLILIPEFNTLACGANKRTHSKAYSGTDFNRMFPVGGTPTTDLAKEVWNLLKSEQDLAFVVDFHDGFVNSLGNTLIHTRQSKASTVANRIKDQLNKIRPSGATGPKWRALTEPIGGSLTRKVGRDLNIPAMEVELSGRSPRDPLRLRKEYAWTVIRMVGREFDMTIGFAAS